MGIACFIRYQIEPSQRAAFQEYAAAWGRIISRWRDVSATRLSRPIALGLLIFGVGGSNVVAGDNVDIIHFPSEIGTLNLGMRHVAASHPNGHSPVLILHGATFPSGNAAGWKMDGHSWMDQLAEQGYDVFALDFLGYGESDRYPEMLDQDAVGPALGDVPSMVRQVERAEAAIVVRTRAITISLIAHSAGTFVAARYAELHPDRVEKLILFGAPTPSNGTEVAQTSSVRFFQVSAVDQRESFEPRVRSFGRLDPHMFSEWATTYLASDAQSNTRHPASVRVPTGMMAAVDEMNRTHNLPYHPEKVACPTLVIQGDWDAVTPPSKGLWLFERIGASFKRLVILSQGGHRLHLEKSRFQLYQEVQAFLDARADGGFDSTDSANRKSE